MPIRAPRICSPCGLRVASGELCPCERRRKASHDAARPSARERGYDSKWDKARADYLAQPENRLCGRGCGRPATLVHHKIPHRGDKKLFWHRSNWMPACQPCHDGPLQSQERRSGQ